MNPGKKKVCVITAARSEYGLLRWLIEEIRQDEELILQLLVTGSHLSVEQGLTYKLIEADGYVIDEKVEMLLSSLTDSGIVKSMGLCSLGIADVFLRLIPDLIVILGDRYELLPVCSAALVMNIPIAHISGGDITEGAIDDNIRNAVTMMATLHFPGVEDSAGRICQMRGEKKNIWVCGEPGLDNFSRLALWGRDKLADDLKLNIDKKWVLLCYHPETRITIEDNLQVVHHISEVLEHFPDVEVIITKANSDMGGAQINKYWETLATAFPGKYKLYSSLGQLRYLSLMKEVGCLIGNSSSGIVEAPFLGIPVINIGNRQNGRHLCENIVSVTGEKEMIRQALDHLLTDSIVYPSDPYYGDGQSALRIKDHIKDFLLGNVKI